ncbi:MAG TPA: hypothetical protein VGM81_08985 [Burkholderiaceae bacterium]|jgi:hypothetical protein
MQKLRWRSLLWGALFLIPTVARAEEPAVPWRVCVGDLAIMPYLSGDASNSGVTEKLLLAAGKSAGLAVELLHIPYRRCRLMFEAGEVDVLTVGAMPTHLQQLQFPLNKDGALDASRRLARINLVLVRRADTAIDWDGQQLIGADPKTFTAGARNTLRLGIDAMQSMGYRVDDGAISTGQALSKLAAHRIDMAIGLEDEVAQALLHDPALRKRADRAAQTLQPRRVLRRHAQGAAAGSAKACRTLVDDTGQAARYGGLPPALTPNFSGVPTPRRSPCRRASRR